MASKPNPFDKSVSPATTVKQSDPAIEAALTTEPTTDPVPHTTSSALPRDLAVFHRNPRRGDVKAIAASLKAHDQYKPITANIGTKTGRPWEVLAGNHTLMAIRDLAEKYPDDVRWTSVLVHWLDVDDDLCNRIVAADNQTAQLGGFDMEELAGLLAEIGEVNLEDIGFTAADFADITAMVQENTLPDLGGDDDDDPAATTPRRGDDGLIESTPVNDQRFSYEDKSTRLMILTLPIPQFIWAQERLAEIRAEHGHLNNTEAVLGLISAAAGEDPPLPDAEVSPEAIEAAESAESEPVTAQ